MEVADMQQLIVDQQKVIGAQTDTIARLVRMMSEEQGSEDEEPSTYLDGSRRQ